MNEEESSRGVLNGTVSEFLTSESKIGQKMLTEKYGGTASNFARTAS